MVETIERQSGSMPVPREDGRTPENRTPECLAPRHRGIGLPALAAAVAQMSRASAAEASRPHPAQDARRDGLQERLRDDVIAA